MDYRISQSIKQGNDPILSRMAFENDGMQTRNMYIAKYKINEIE